MMVYGLFVLSIVNGTPALPSLTGQGEGYCVCSEVVNGSAIVMVNAPQARIDSLMQSNEYVREANFERLAAQYQTSRLALTRVFVGKVAGVPPAYALPSDDVGLLHSSTLDEVALYDDTLLLAYRNERLQYDEFDLYRIDLTTESVAHFIGLRGRAARFVQADGVVYIGSGDPGYFGVLKDNTFRVIGACSDRDYYSGTVSADGCIWMGTYPAGKLECFDPRSGKLLDHGRIDDAGGIQYVYTLAADSQYVYAGMGQADWYLGIYDIDSDTTALFFKGIGNRVANVYTAQVGGAPYYERIDSAGGRHWYALASGVPVEITNPPALVPWYASGGIISDVTQQTRYQFDLRDAGAYSGHDPLIRWQSGEVALPAPVQAPVRIKRLADVGAERLLGVGNFYAPVFWYDAEQEAVEVVGLPTYSLYDALTHEGDIYLSGYTAVTLRWNPQEAWTLKPGATGVTNPRKIPLAIGKYHYYSCIGADGLFYVAANHERDSVGGELGWYDPLTEATGRLRAPFARWSPRGLVVVGDKLVYSGQSLDNETGRVFIVSTETHEVVAEHDVEGATEAGALVAVSDTEIVGVVNLTAYRLNILTGAEVWRVTLPAKAFGTLPHYDRRPCYADGAVWLALGTNIYRIDAETGTVTKFSDETEAYNVLVSEGTVYLYGGIEVKPYPLP